MLFWFRFFFQVETQNIAEMMGVLVAVNQESKFQELAV
jgi:hypothetical protein